MSTIAGQDLLQNIDGLTDEQMTPLEKLIWAEFERKFDSGDEADVEPACDELAALRLRVQSLEAALKPFAEFGTLYLPVDATDKTSPWVLADDEHIIPAGHLDAPRVGEFRRAAIALQPDMQRDAPDEQVAP